LDLQPLYKHAPQRSFLTKALNNLKFTFPMSAHKQIIRIFVNPFAGIY